MLSRQLRALALPAVLSVALAACGRSAGLPVDGPGAGYHPSQSSTTSPALTSTTPDDSETPTTEDPVPKPAPIPAPGGGDVGLPTGPVPDSVRERPDVAEAIRAHAERMGVEPVDVTVAGFEEVTWSDGSLGCPQPGMMYTQALVPGYRLVLAVERRLASYHAARDRPFSYCETPTRPLQVRSPNS